MTTTCIVLAGGLGTRLRSVVADVPKCLAPVAGSTVIAWHIQMLRIQGFSKFILSLGYKAELFFPEIERLQATHPQAEFSVVIEDEPLGTGGAILHAMSTAKIEQAVVTNGDTMTLASLHNFHTHLSLDTQELVRMGVCQTDDSSRFGRLHLQGNKVVDFAEKSHSGKGFINAGIYRMDRSALSAFSTGAKFSLEQELLPQLASSGALYASTLDAPITDVGIPKDYLEFCRAQELVTTGKNFRKNHLP
jgi:D-glycero-alpha-D-manno-heptose 1-phosphate guanylyltransferase